MHLVTIYFYTIILIPYTLFVIIVFNFLLSLHILKNVLILNLRLFLAYILVTQGVDLFEDQNKI